MVSQAKLEVRDPRAHQEREDLKVPRDLSDLMELMAEMVTLERSDPMENQ